ncbi:MAG TPA: hypothetical protein ENJ56_02875 [Anaerolineae bacterium]|nr:hypothetical protein [Anaerolineae bacterium]
MLNPFATLKRPIRLRRKKLSRWQLQRKAVSWWRVRYPDVKAATQGIQDVAANLAEPLVVAMAVVTDNNPLPALWLGVPGKKAWVQAGLKRYGVYLTALDTGIEPAPIQMTSDVPQWARVTEWPRVTGDTWVGMIVAGQLYVAWWPMVQTEAMRAVAWPIATGQHPAAWQLPQPCVGLASQLPPIVIEPLPDPFASIETGFYLGRNGDQPVYADGKIQVWGDSHALQKWTTSLILRELKRATKQFVIFDGDGALASTLPLYTEFSTAQKAGRLLYSHADDDLRQQGFNPLLPLPWESGVQTAARWQRWLAQLGVWPTGCSLLRVGQIALCEAAVQSGVCTLTGFIRWLSVEEHPLTQTESAYVKRALQQIKETPQYVEWLRPSRRILDHLLAGSLVFAGNIRTSAAQQTMQMAVLDALLTLPELTLVVRGVSADLLRQIAIDRWPARLVMVNGVKLSDSLKGIGSIANAARRQKMSRQAFGVDSAEYYERLTVSPKGSVFWLTNPIVQTL